MKRSGRSPRPRPPARFPEVRSGPRGSTHTVFRMAASRRLQNPDHVAVTSLAPCFKAGRSNSLQTSSGMEAGGESLGASRTTRQRLAGQSWARPLHGTGFLPSPREGDLRHSEFAPMSLDHLSGRAGAM
jgi:hypothetical protein